MASKEYFCKDCDINNHGWCPKRGTNKLKEIEYCGDKVKDGIPISGKKGTDSTPRVNIAQRASNEPKLLLTKSDLLKSKNYGKREMFYHVQCQIQAMSEADSLTSLKQVMTSLEQMLLIEEGIQGIAIDGIVESDIVNNSKALSSMWLKEFGTYKGN